MVDTSPEPLSRKAPAERSRLVRFGAVLLAIIAIGEGFVIWYGRALAHKEEQQRVLNAHWEEQHVHARSIAAAFLRSVVEDDFPATRTLLAQVASTKPGSAEARGPEARLRDKVHAWFAERKLNRKRLKGYGFGGDHPSTSLTEGRCVQVGGLLFDDGRVVNYVLTLVRIDPENGSRSSRDTGCWRVDDFVLWAGEGDGPRPW
jgi:hypothetical protein